MQPAWSGRRSQQAKAYCIAHYGWTCHLCGKPIDDPTDYTVDHVIPRSIAPHLTWTPSNWRPAHGKKRPDCPGNYGRGSRRPPKDTASRAW